MSLVRMAWRNLSNRKLQTLLTVLVIALGIAMSLSVMIVSSGIKQGIAEASKPYGMLVGSKGSANQLVFNTIYLMDTPLANLPLAYVEELQQDERVQLAVPFGLGDHYRGYRIVGTTEQFFELRTAPSEEPYFQIAEGRIFQQPFEAVVGRKAARATGLGIGDTFLSGHGVIQGIEEDHSHAEHPYTVVGIMEELSAPADMGIYVPIESYWISHGQLGPNDAEEPGVTSLLVQPDSYMHLMQLYSEINNGQIAQAVFPGQVLAKVFDMMGSGEQVWAYVSYVVMGMAVLTILLFLYNATLEKRRHIAIMRAIGAGRRRIFSLVILESAWVVALGSLLGIVLTYGLSYAASVMISRNSTLSVILSFSRDYAGVIGVVWAAGLIAALMPAVIAYRTEIAKHLQASW
ncbi:ABC transporter permease [Insulibacter thermoxylanivorax]|uniref:Putative hemin transport system permease protein HrtB n=1 Tax=Insulibacter thermoxylanivorax TaxID=2749268 RepID=A0A916VGI5_9BACL|nr:ABC transporter permease [Insulibacter thermoxylanivorax]GFR38749.1 ABC transporter permease [Insulibacter thermoxylanivorax]